MAGGERVNHGQNLALGRWFVNFGETRGIEERVGRPSRYWALQALAAGDRENLKLILDVLEYLPDHVALMARFDHRDDFQLAAARIGSLKLVCHVQSVFHAPNGLVTVTGRER